MSVPSSKLVNPHATAAAAPPDDPPVVRPRSHGLLVVPNSTLWVWKSADQVGALVLPNNTPPAAERRGDRRCIHARHMVGQCRCASGRAHEPGFDGVLHGERQSVQRPQPRPARCRLVRPRGVVVRPPATSVVITALTWELSRSIFARTASRSSRLDRERDLRAAASRVADQRVGSSGTSSPPLWPRKLPGDLELGRDHDGEAERQRHVHWDLARHRPERATRDSVRPGCPVSRKKDPGTACRHPDPAVVACLHSSIGLPPPAWALASRGMQTITTRGRP